MLPWLSCSYDASWSKGRVMLVFSESPPPVLLCVPSLHSSEFAQASGDPAFLVSNLPCVIDSPGVWVNLTPSGVMLSFRIRDEVIEGGIRP